MLPKVSVVMVRVALLLLRIHLGLIRQLVRFMPLMDMILSDDLSTENTLTKGREIRYAAPYIQDGVNVNLVHVTSTHEIDISTYERGVEGETLACGTGATACALFLAYRNELTQGTVVVNAKGGKLAVRFVRNASGFEQIWLFGPAEKVFNGEINLL